MIRSLANRIFQPRCRGLLGRDAFYFHRLGGDGVSSAGRAAAEPRPGGQRPRRDALREAGDPLGVVRLRLRAQPRVHGRSLCLLKVLF